MPRSVKLSASSICSMRTFNHLMAGRIPPWDRNNSACFVISFFSPFIHLLALGWRGECIFFCSSPIVQYLRGLIPRAKPMTRLLLVRAEEQGFRFSTTSKLFQPFILTRGDLELGKTWIIHSGGYKKEQLLIWEGKEAWFES